MSRPGTTITRSENRPARSARATTGPWFTAGITGTADAGGGVRVPVYSLSEYATRFGSRASHSDASMYDAAENYFKEGGSSMFVSRTADALDATLTTALDLYTRDLGPGQVSAPGRTAGAQHLIVAAHAAAKNRIGILDGPDTATVATLNSAATVASITQDQERYAAIFGPFITVPASTPGTTKNIAPCSLVAGIMSRNDGNGVSQNEPSAGLLGQSQVALAVKYSFIDADRTTLNANSFNLIRDIGGDVKIYGYRTLSDQSSDANWSLLSNARLFMTIQALAEEVAERFIFRQIDGQRKTIAEFGGALTGILIPFWQKGSLYGSVPEEAFRVDVGPTVNTDATIANNELHAVIGVRTSPFAEEVVLEIVKTRITEAL